MEDGADVPGRIRRLPGGVALNIAMTLARLGLKPTLLSAVGKDAEGDELLRLVAAMGIDTRQVLRSESLPTDRYMAIEGPDGLIAAVADAHSLEAAADAILAPLHDGRLGTAGQPWTGLIALDGNLTTDLLGRIAVSSLFAHADLRLAPASPGKAERLRPMLGHPNATLYLNLFEAGMVCQRRFNAAPDAAQALLELGAFRVLVTNGGNLCAEGRHGQGIITAKPPQVQIVKVTGAGDTLMAAHIKAEYRGALREDALQFALRSAAQFISGEVLR